MAKEETEDKAAEDEEEQPQISEKRRELEKRIKARQKRGGSRLCYKFLAGKCDLKDCVFEHRGVETFDDQDKCAMMREVLLRPTFDPVLAHTVKQLHIQVCKEYLTSGECRKGWHCRWWHIENAWTARWAGYAHFCEQCWKPINGDEAWAEHIVSKKHLSNVGKSGMAPSGGADEDVASESSAPPKGRGRGSHCLRGNGRGGGSEKKGRGYGRGGDS